MTDVFCKPLINGGLILPHEMEILWSCSIPSFIHSHFWQLQILFFYLILIYHYFIAPSKSHIHTIIYKDVYCYKILLFTLVPGFDWRRCLWIDEGTYPLISSIASRVYLYIRFAHSYLFV